MLFFHLSETHEVSDVSYNIRVIKFFFSVVIYMSSHLIVMTFILVELAGCLLVSLL